jgi:hypothetical protein
VFLYFVGPIVGGSGIGGRAIPQLLVEVFTSVPAFLVDPIREPLEVACSGWLIFFQSGHSYVWRFCALSEFRGKETN